LPSADTLTLEVPRTRLSFGDRAFSVAGPRAWNSLPINVYSAQAMFSSRKLLRTIFFSLRILDLIRVLIFSGVLVAFFAYFALNLSFLRYITLTSNGSTYVVGVQLPSETIHAHICYDARPKRGKREVKRGL